MFILIMLFQVCAHSQCQAFKAIQISPAFGRGNWMPAPNTYILCAECHSPIEVRVEMFKGGYSF